MEESAMQKLLDKSPGPPMTPDPDPMPRPDPEPGPGTDPDVNPSTRDPETNPDVITPPVIQPVPI